jgi:ATP-dependent DNA ligase
LLVGYEPSFGFRGGFGSLLTAAYKGDDFAYVGKVGTGFKEREAIALRATMKSSMVGDATTHVLGQARRRPDTADFDCASQVQGVD